MRVTIILSSLAALSTRVSAGALIDRYIGNFRSFSEVGCFDAPNEANLGVWTVLASDVTPHMCHDFNGADVKSTYMTALEASTGCKMVLYTDDRCAEGRQEIAQDECKSAEKRWKRWAMECGRGYGS